MPSDSEVFEKNLMLDNLIKSIDSNLEVYFSLQESDETIQSLADIIWAQKEKYERISGKQYLHKGYGCLLLPLESHRHRRV